MILTGETYANLCKHVFELCAQSHVQIHDENNLDKFLHSPGFAKAQNSLIPAIPLEDVILNIEKFITKAGREIIFYAAVKQQKETKPLAARYLKEWKTGLESCIRNRMGEEPQRKNIFLNTQGVSIWKLERSDLDIDEMMTDLVKGMAWPRIQETEKRKQKLMSGLEHPLAQEYVYRKFHGNRTLFYSEQKNEEVPSHVIPLFKLSSLTPAQEYLIKTYLRKTQDETMAESLSIEVEAAPDADFNLDLIQNNMPWGGILDRVKSAKHLIYALEGLERLIAKFSEIPSSELKECWTAVDTLQYLRNVIDENLKANFELKLGEALIKAWRNAPIEAWTGSISSGMKLRETIMDLMKKNMGLFQRWGGELATAIKLKEQINLSNYPGHQILSDAPITLATVYRVRDLLAAWRDMGWKISDSLASGILHELSCRASKLQSKNTSASANERHSDVMALELLNEIYLEFSQYKGVGNAGPFAKLLPNNFQLYRYAVPQSLACAFVLKISDKIERESLLYSIVSSFGNYDKLETYPIRKLALGVIEDSDIPEWDKGGFLERMLLGYRGVFAEDVRDQVKDFFWDALFNKHRLLKAFSYDETSDPLIDSLALFCRKNYNENDKWYQKGWEVLNKIAGNSPDPSFPKAPNTVSERARERLMDNIQARLKL